MKASVWANVLEGQEKARERQEDIPSDQVEGDITQTLPRNYPGTTQKQDIDITPVQKGIIDFLLLQLGSWLYKVVAFFFCIIFW